MEYVYNFFCYIYTCAQYFWKYFFGFFGIVTSTCCLFFDWQKDMMNKDKKMIVNDNTSICLVACVYICQKL